MRRALALALVLAACAGPRTYWKASPLVGKPLEVTALDQEGRPVRLDAGRGQVLMVDFFATWCDPCREQLPFLDRLSTALGPRGLAVSAVAFDEDRSVVDAFVRQVAVGFPVLWDKGGATLADRFEVTRLPTTLLVGRDGIVRSVHLGYERADEPLLRAEVEKLLAERSPVRGP
ncbi:MAG TPA: TlpA disulfide reductase family protein [Anaeromyxobacteraceae bacterium]|nr:TlpA disulfide reductase family protein [Anaeromyxobacteraceae bacterium]